MQNDFWSQQRILVTGGNGFLGSHVTELLRQKTPGEIHTPSSKEYDFRKADDCAQAVQNIDLVIHLAANVGGIGYNQRFPGTLFYDNLVMGAHLMEEARKAGVKKFVSLGTVCAYPKLTPVPFKEEDLWNGYPEETNAPYGLAKKMLLVQGQAYRQQYDFNAIYLVPVNLYGPGDNFELNSSHVIPALIRKFIEAKKHKKKTVTIWGTGKPTREFLYVKDAARAILLASEHYSKADPVNIGSAFEISIAELAKVIQELVDFPGQIKFDTSKPDGQPRRKLDVSKAQQEFGFTSEVDFKEGLKQTIEWYLQNTSNAH